MTRELRAAISPPPWAAFTAATLALAACVAVGHDGRRIAQLTLLALPPLLWLLWPLQQPRWRRLRVLLAVATVVVFVVDGLARGYLQARYHAAPDSSLVLAAVANSNPRESTEYLQAHGREIALWLVASIAAALVIGAGLALASRASTPPSRAGRRALVALLLLCAVAVLSKPWRRLHPLLFWPHWAGAVSELRGDWAAREAARERERRQAAALAPRGPTAGPATVTMVLTDSVNRDNMSAYGYPRDTTPRLRQKPQLHGNHWLVLSHAWSAAPGTLASLEQIFGFGEPPAADPPHLLALARSAGYKVFWITNHDDIAIDQIHARHADVVVGVNRQPGRSGVTLDGEVLDDVARALADPAPLKFVVVHLLGAHPHYRLRIPPDRHPFDAGEDGVDAALEAAGRPLWVREMRQDYDAAIHYQDEVVAELLRMTHAAAPAASDRAFLYLSDHGQEVGHAVDRVGHSPGTEAGYRIPAMLWRSSTPFGRTLATRPFRADWAAHTVADLLQLQWPGALPQRNVLSEGYRWEPPPLPLAGVRFDR